MFVLKPTIQKGNSKAIIGFDIETYDNNKGFLLASAYDGNQFYDFGSKRECIDFFKSRRCRNSFIACSNLGFDFFGVFFGSDEVQEFKTLFRGSNLLTAYSYIKNGKFTSKSKNRQSKITFIDTMNYASLSVDNLGKIVKIPKLKESVKSFIGQYPKNKREWEVLRRYNHRDAQISQKAIEFLFNSFYELGATPKMTIASTSMSLFKNKYLDTKYFLHPVPVLLDQFKGYYGGNTHAYSRGLIEDYYYYDFNSLYPSVMIKELPDPNTLRISEKNSLRHIADKDGMSHVSVHCPTMKYPLLCYRYENKLITPIGRFSGWYTHVELRKAMELGYTIEKVHKTYYYQDNCIPLYRYVKDLYHKRREYLTTNNMMQLVVKILLNGLYGKFGQRFQNRDNVIPFNHTIEELNRLQFFERIGSFLRIKETKRPSAFCIPIWASYITSYARLKLHSFILRSNPVYVDTDSLITKERFLTGSGLGDLKLEMKIRNGIIVKPKMYCISDGSDSFVKIKGLGVKLKERDFYAFLDNPKKTYMKFMKFKEAIRRNKIPNEIVEMTKEYDLEDNKRVWLDRFNPRVLEHSYPYPINEPIEIIKEQQSLNTLSV